MKTLVMLVTFMSANSALAAQKIQCTTFARSQIDLTIEIEEGVERPKMLFTAVGELTTIVAANAEEVKSDPDALRIPFVTLRGEGIDNGSGYGVLTLNRNSDGLFSGTGNIHFNKVPAPIGMVRFRTDYPLTNCN